MTDPPKGFIRLEDGMPDPMPDDELTRARREAIEALLKLMGCHHLRSSNCDHVDAIVTFGQTVVATTTWTAQAAIRELPRPLNMRDIVQVFESMGVATLLGSQKGHR